jgi:MFS transporter, DHA1 family, inner membrane transport protein
MRIRYRVLLLASARMIVTTGMRMVYPFLAVFARGMGVDLQAVTLAITVRSSTGLLAPFLAALVEQWGRKVGLLVGILIIALSAFIVIIFPTYPAFFTSLILSFLGMYIYVSACQAYLGDTVAYEQRGLAMAVVESGWSWSFIIGMPVLAFLIGRFGWIAPFPLLVVTSLLLAALIWRLLPPSPKDSRAEATRSNAAQALRLVFTSPVALTALAMTVLITAANEVVVLVFGVWLEDSFGLRLAALGSAAALIGVAELTGELGSGGVIDRLGKKRAVMIGLIVNCLAALALPWMGGKLWSGLLGLAIFYLSFEFTIISDFTLMTGVMPAARATLLGSNVAATWVGRMLGALLVPTLYEWGFWTNALAALVINLLAIAVLMRVSIAEEES